MNKSIVSTLMGAALVLASGSALAQNTPAKPMKVVCVTTYPSTSFIGESDGKTFKVRVIHHNSTQYMPIHNGTITPNDLPLMAKKAETLAKLGGQYEVEWKIEKCKTHANKRFECYGGEPAEINGVKYHPFAIYSTRLTTDSIAGKINSMQVSLSLEVEGEDHSFAMDYQDHECAIEL